MDNTILYESIFEGVPGMGKKDIDLERVVADPAYRRKVIRELNGRTRRAAGKDPAGREQVRRPREPGLRDDGSRISRD